MQIRTKNIKNPDDFLSELDHPTPSALTEGAFFLFFAFLILLFGLSVLYSTSYAESGSSMFMKQMTWAGIGSVFFLAAVLIGYHRLASFSPLLLIGLILMLLLPITVMKRAVNGAYRWISLGPIRIQPSEFAKVVMVLFWADFLSRNARAVETSPLKRVCPIMFGSVGIVCLLIMAGKDLGTTSLIGILFFAMMYAGGMPWWIVFPLPVLGLCAFIAIDNPIVQSILARIGILTPYRLARITSYQNPEVVADKEGYQLWLSQLALGSGNWFGMGFTESRLKLKYLPEAHTDFILAIVGEELGFFFILLVILTYLLLTFFGFAVSCKARTKQGMLIAFGVSAFMAIQAFINIGVICGALPTKGMPAPLISYGGSNLVTCLAAIGLVFSVALDTAFPDYPENLRKKLNDGWKRFAHSPAKRQNNIERENEETPEQEQTPETEKK